MTQPLLETRDLTKRFGALVANDGINLSVSEGEIRGIIGPNGSGKTTFFNTITGFYTPDAGQVLFRGRDVTGWKPNRLAREGLARTFQVVSPFRNMSVRENLLAVQTTASSDKASRAEEILHLLDIDHLADHKARGMSGGQHKLLELARILMLDPTCVLLDEPTGGVNPALEDRILTYIQDLNEDGQTFVVIEHDMDVMRRLAGTVTVFDQGQVLVEGSFDEVKDDPRVQDAYLGTAEDEEGALF